MNGRKNLILGFGSDILSDGGIGIKLVNDLNSKNSFKNTEYKTAFLGGLDLLHQIQGYFTIILIDGIVTGSRKPGNVSIHQLNENTDTINLTNIHDISLYDTIKLGRSLKIEVPEVVYVISVEVIDFTTISDKLSSTIRNKYPNILNEVKLYAKNMINADLYV